MHHHYCAFKTWQVSAGALRPGKSILANITPEFPVSSGNQERISSYYFIMFVLTAEYPKHTKTRRRWASLDSAAASFPLWHPQYHILNTHTHKWGTRSRQVWLGLIFLLLFAEWARENRPSQFPSGAAHFQSKRERFGEHILLFASLHLVGNLCEPWFSL